MTKLRKSNENFCGTIIVARLYTNPISIRTTNKLMSYFFVIYFTALYNTYSKRKNRLISDDTSRMLNKKWIVKIL